MIQVIRTVGLLMFMPQRALEQTIRRLLDACLNKWHTLYMDNFYNSVELAESLLKDKVHTGGTMRLKRCQGKDVRLAGTKQNKLAKGQSVARDNGKVMTMCCMDKKPVDALSTKHDGSMIEISRRKKGGHGEIEVFKPACICDYNQHMSGVDRMDQMISYYPCSRKSFKWWKKLLFYLLEISIHNAHVLYNLRGKKMSLYDFQLTIVRAFCKVDDVITSSSEDGSPTPTLRSPVHDPSTRLYGGYKRHHIERIPDTEKVCKPQKRCRVCYRKGSRKETRHLCKECNVPLCLGKCFENYHSKNEL